MDKSQQLAAEGPLAFGDQDEQSIFRQLELVRKKQIEMAREHIKLETAPSDGLATGGDTEEDIAEAYRKNAERFARKESDILKLMDTLEELGGLMSRFHIVSTAKDRAADDAANTSIIAPASSEPTQSAASLASVAPPSASAADLGVGSDISLTSSAPRSVAAHSAESVLNSSQRSLESSVLDSNTASSVQSPHTARFSIAGGPEVVSIPRQQHRSRSGHSVIETLDDRNGGPPPVASRDSPGSVQQSKPPAIQRTPLSSSSRSLQVSQDDLGMQ